MKKPNLNSLVLRLWPLGLALSGLAADAPPPDSAAAPMVAVNSGSQIALDVTPAALSTSHIVVKVNLARWLNGARLVEPQTNGDLKTIVYEDYATAQNVAQIKDAAAPATFGALLDDDATVQVPFQQGETSIIVDVGIMRTIEHFGFFSFSAAGSVDIYYSSTSPDSAKTTDKSWQSANIHQAFGSRRIVNVDLKSLDARFVMMVFKMNAAGSIGPVALFSSVDLKHPLTAPNQEDANGKVKIVPPEDLVEFDYAQSAYGSKVSDVSGGQVEQAQNVLNSDPSQHLTLGAANTTETVKPENIFIVDMGQKRDINKVGLLFSTEGNGTFSFYFLDTLPTKPKDTKTAFDEFQRRPQPILLASNDNALAEALFLAQDAPPVIQQVDYLPTDFFSTNKPGFTQAINSSNNTGRIAGVFDNTEKFRFALVRWMPQDPNQPPVDVFRVNLIGKVPMEDFGLASSDTVNALDPTGILQPAVTPGTPGPPVHLDTPPPPPSPPTTDPPPTQPPTPTPPTPPTPPPTSL
jgi:hypothetical protein